jgi:DNA-binding Xre family transcriptional regulator
LPAFYHIFQILDQPMVLVRVTREAITIHETNEAFCRLSGYRHNQLQSASLDLLINSHLPCDSSLHFTQETYLTTANQQDLAVHVEFRALTVTDEDDASYALIMFEDRSENIPLENAIIQVFDSAKRLKMWMAKRDISTNQLAASTNISLQTISKLRNGHIQKPNRLTAELIASELQVAVRDIWPEVRNSR